MITFWILAVLIVASAVFVVSAARPVYSVLGLLFNFLCLAIMYLTLDAEFLAVIQVVVYSGAILMLFVFVIALLSSGVRAFSSGQTVCRASSRRYRYSEHWVWAACCS